MKRAGESTRKMAQRRRRITNVILLGVLILGAILFLLINNWKALGLSSAAVVVLLIIMRLLVDLIDKPIDKRIRMEERADRGAVAEEAVGHSLSDLGEDYHIIHDVSSPYGNIDHVLLSRSGNVYLIETKSHGGGWISRENRSWSTGDPRRRISSSRC